MVIREERSLSPIYFHLVGWCELRRCQILRLVHEWTLEIYVDLSPIVPLMSLNVPVPIRYRRVEASSGSITSSTAIPSVVSTSNSTNVDLSAFSHGPEYRCACTLYADVRKLIVASFRWSRTDGLPVLLNKAERHFPTLNTLLRSNVVAAVIDAREEERTTRPSRNQTMEQHHQEFLNDFEEWMREN